MLGFVGMRELSNNTKKVMLRLKKKGSLILTDNGKPIAALIPIKDEEYGFEEVYDLVKQYEIQSTLSHIANSNINNPNRNMTMEEIDAEIAKARKERHEREKKEK
ncbi:MAG: type II toxin-antitoxin system prevent-host-death family antitoxin [Bacilli bacterium]|nr:type II toxin-antitoxin system prevent-host-death family antitoxin [Bacilli bacterium]